MDTLLPILLGIAAFATLLVLVIGVVGFAFNGPFYQKHANNLMRLRVAGQAIAVAMLALVVFFISMD